jgi:dienelactone hydrolase
MASFRLAALTSHVTTASARSHIGAPPPFRSSWDDLLDGVESADEWPERRAELKAKFLALLRDEHAPPRPSALDVRVHDETVVDGTYVRQLISYAVDDEGERCHAFLAFPLHAPPSPLPAVVALHGTYEEGLWQAAALVEGAKGEAKGEGNKGYLDHLARRGYAVIAPEHFNSCFREATDRPGLRPYDTSAFHKKHPQWTAVGKFTLEHSIAVDVLLGGQTAVEVDPLAIGVMGHSLGGHGSFFLAAYDERICVSVCNCGAAFFRHNATAEAWARDEWYICE